MGFFDSATNFLGGGRVGSSVSGVSALPPSISKAFTGYSSALRKLFSPENAGLFSIRPEEQASIDQMISGITPTDQSISSDISLQMNPFNEYVISDINKQAEGEYSILKQALSNAGQFASSPELTGAADIEGMRLDTIGKLKQDQYNIALENALTRLPGLRQQDISYGLSAGDFLRSMDTSGGGLPLHALRQYASLLGALPQSASTSSSSSNPGASSTMEGLASIGSLISAGSTLFSDKRLKRGIKKVLNLFGGLNLYKFKYLWSDKEYIGVLAQEVLKVKPEAVILDDSGFYKVNYSLIGLEMRAV